MLATNNLCPVSSPRVTVYHTGRKNLFSRHFPVINVSKQCLMHLNATYITTWCICVTLQVIASKAPSYRTPSSAAHTHARTSLGVDTGSDSVLCTLRAENKEKPENQGAQSTKSEPKPRRLSSGFAESSGFPESGKIQHEVDSPTTSGPVPLLVKPQIPLQT